MLIELLIVLNMYLGCIDRFEFFVLGILLEVILGEVILS